MFEQYLSHKREINNIFTDNYNQTLFVAGFKLNYKMKMECVSIFAYQQARWSEEIHFNRDIKV